MKVTICLGVCVALALSCSSAPGNDGGTGGGEAAGGGMGTGGGTAAGGGSGGGAATGGGENTGGGMGTGGSVGMPTAGVPPVRAASEPAVGRGEMVWGTTEKYNRYYTQKAWAPAKTVYVSPTGMDNGSSPSLPASVASGLSQATAGTKVIFQAGTYNGCFQIDDMGSGTYDAPVVLYGERDMVGTLLVKINCCNTGRRTCLNLEAADYVAVDGFELIGGDYGVRAVGSDYPAANHQKGIAVLNCDGHDQNKDPFFTGQSDWYVVEKNKAHSAGAGDGHGIYLSNGSDYNIARLNQLWSNHSADFQINADPASTCEGVSVAFTDPKCDGDAAAGLGQGASDYMLVEGNFFHHGDAQGANFTSVRKSVVRNNIFAFYARHGVSFWQETSNPKLGSSDNLVMHNLFVTDQANRQAVQFIVDSTRNIFKNNVLVGTVANALLMEVDASVSANVYANNFYAGGRIEGRMAGASETVSATFNPNWFASFPVMLSRDPTSYFPVGSAPFKNAGPLLPDALLDRVGNERVAPVDLGPFEVP